MFSRVTARRSLCKKRNSANKVERILLLFPVMGHFLKVNNSTMHCANTGAFLVRTLLCHENYNMHASINVTERESFLL